MKQFFSLTLKIVLTLTLLIAAILVSLPFLIDPNDYKDTISEQVKIQTGRTLHIPGEIKLSVFPWLGAKLGEVSLENAEGFAEKGFLRMDEIDVRIQLLPLLKGDIKIGHLTLRGLRVNLQRDKQGRNNWDDLLPAATEETTQPDKAAPIKPAPVPSTKADPASTPAADISPAAALAALSIEGISIEDASLHWDDQQTQQNYQIEKLSVEIGHISLDEAISLELSFRVNSQKPAASARVELTTQLQLNIEKQQLKLIPFTSKIDYSLDKSAEMAALSGTSEFTSELHLDLKKQKYTLKQLRLNNTIHSSLLPTGQLDAQIESKKIRLDLNKQSLKTEYLLIKAYGLEIQSRLNVQQLLGKPRYLASVDLQEFSPRQLLKTLKMESLLPVTRDKDVLIRTRLGLRIIGSIDDLLLKPMILQVDDSNLQGYISIKHFKQPVIRYKLVLDKMDFDRYLPPALENTKVVSPGKPAPINLPGQHIADTQNTASSQTPVSTITSTKPTIPLPLELLRNLNIDGKLTIGQLKVANLQLDEITLGTVAKKGQLRLKPLSAKLYQGRYNGDIQLDVRRNTPRVRLNESLKNIAIGPLLKDLMGDDTIRGTATIQAKLSSSLGQGGLNILAAKKSLNGTLNFIVKNGAVKGFNLAQYERELTARLKKQAPPENKAPLETDFAHLSGSTKITRGLLDNRDLRAALPHARVRGQGKADLVKEQLDYRLDIKFTSRAEGQSGKRWDQMNTFILPVYIKGAFAQPDISVDYQSVIKGLAKQELKKQEQKIKARLRKEEKKLKQKANDELKQEEEKIKKKAKDALKKLFNF